MRLSWIAPLAAALALAPSASRAQTVIWERPGVELPAAEGSGPLTAEPIPALRLEVLGLGGGGPGEGRAAVLHPKALLRMTGVLASPPERDRLRVRYRVGAIARVRARVLDASGEAVRTFEETFVNPGRTAAVEWTGLLEDGAEAPSGVYALEIEAAPAGGGDAPSIRRVPIDLRSPPRVSLRLPEGGVNVDALPSGVLQIPFAAPGPTRMSAYLLAHNEAEDRFEVLAPLLAERTAESGALVWRAADAASGVYYLLVISSADTEAALPEPATHMNAGLPIRAEIHSLRVRGALGRAADLLGERVAPALAALAERVAGGGA